jgi:hypothetical protein
MERLNDLSPYEGHDLAAHPGDMRGWGSTDRIFEQVIRIIRPALIVEVGTWKGASAIHMGRLARNLGFSTEIICVDTWLGSPEHIHPHWRSSLRLRNGYPQIHYTFLTNIIENQLTDVIIPLPATSENAAKILFEKNIRPDTVYIDATHEYKPVLRDLRTFWVTFERHGGADR